MKKAIAGVLLLSGLVLSGCTDQTVASSTAGKISQDQLYDKMKDAVGTQVLQQMLLEDVLKKDSGNAVSDKDVDAAFNVEVERFGGEASLSYALMSEGMTIDQYKENIHLNLLVKEAVKKAAGFTDDELKQAYDEYEPAATAAHILVTEEEKAKELTEQLNDGADFAELAQENSEDTGSAAQGGEVTFSKGEMVPEFEEAALALKEGEMTKEPVKSSYGYHIIKMISKPEKGTFDEERDVLLDQLVEEKMADSEFVHTVLSDIVKKSNIIINDEDLSTAMDSYKPLPAQSDSDSGAATDSEMIEEDEETNDTTEDSSTTDSTEDSSTTDSSEDSE